MYTRVPKSVYYCSFAEIRHQLPVKNFKQVSLTINCHNHTPKTNPRHREEELQKAYIHKTSDRLFK